MQYLVHHSYSFFAVFLAAITFFVPAEFAYGQDNSLTRLEGRVTTAGTDQSLPSVNIYIPGLERGTATGVDGRYMLEGLPAKSLTIRFSYVGYETVTRTVELSAGETTTLDVQLESRRFQGEEVTVTGTPTATDVMESAQDVDVISPEELELQRTASLGKLLENLPGVSNIQTGAQAGKPVLRGLSGNRIRVLEDGIGQEYYQNGVRHFPTTSLTEAQRVEVVRGASSILYGSDALGGAINIISKPLPNPSSGQTMLKTKASTQYFSNNNEKAGALHLEGHESGIGFRAGVERRLADDFTTPDHPSFFQTGAEGDPKYTGEVPFTNFKQLTGYLQTGYQGAWGSVRALYDHWGNYHNFLLPTGGPEGSGNPPVGLGQRLMNDNLQVRGNFPGGTFVVKPIFSYQRSVRQSAAPGTSFEDRPAWPLDLAKNVYTGRLELLHPEVAGIEGTLGAEIVRQETDQRAQVELEPSSTVTSTGIFAFEEYASEPWTISAGGRLDYRRQEALPNERTTDEDLLANTYTVASGAVGANYRLNEWAALASNFSLGFRAPSMFELYASGVHGGVAAMQRGNPILDPERSYSIDMALRLRSEGLRGKITAYQNRIANYIYLRNTGETAENGLPIFVSAQTDAVLRGLDAGLRVNAASWLQVGGQLGVLSSSGEGLGGQEAGALPLLPANRLEGFVRWMPKGVGVLKDSHVQLRVKHVLSKDAAGRYEPFSQFDFGPPFGTASTEAYTLVNLEAGGTLALGSVPVSVHLTAENLLDATYRDFLDTYKGYALSAGRNLGIKLSVPVSIIGS